MKYYISKARTVFAIFSINHIILEILLKIASVSQGDFLLYKTHHLYAILPPTPIITTKIIIIAGTNAKTPSTMPAIEMPLFLPIIFQLQF